MSKITVSDIRAAGYCASGMKRWFASYDFDLRDFIQNGIDEDIFLATGDAHALHVVEVKCARENAGG